MLCATLLCAVLGAGLSLESDLAAVAALPGEPQIVSAAGLAGDESRIATLENASAFDPALEKRRLVLVGADDPAASEAVVAAIRWLKTSAPRAVRDRWIASALPQARFRADDAQSLSRWLTFPAPDLIVAIGGAGLQIQLDGVLVASIPPATVIADLDKLLGAEMEPAALHASIAARVRRDPIDIARVLARRYPEAPSISYIPAVTWVNT